MKMGEKAKLILIAMRNERKKLILIAMQNKRKTHSDCNEEQKGKAHLMKMGEKDELILSEISN